MASLRFPAPGLPRQIAFVTLPATLLTLRLIGKSRVPELTLLQPATVTPALQDEDEVGWWVQKGVEK